MAGISVPNIVEALRARRVGHNRWMALCVAHDERRPSLSIREGDGGRPLVYCFAGCSQDAVIAALRNRGLWTEPQPENWTPTQRTEWTRRRRRAEAEAKACTLWRRGVIAELDAKKLLADVVGDEPMLETAPRELFLIQGADAKTLARAFCLRRMAEPSETARLIAWGREDLAHAEAVGKVVIQLLAATQARIGAR